MAKVIIFIIIFAFLLKRHGDSWTGWTDWINWINWINWTGWTNWINWINWTGWSDWMGVSCWSKVIEDDRDC